MSRQIASQGAWNMLVVDDDADVHSITQLALRRRRWRGRRFVLSSAYSGAEAREVLACHRPDHFNVALVDVVMETGSAGLDLCRYIRKALPRSLRVVLRTGQPDAVPEDVVLNEYDIDFYLAKTEANAESLFSAVRAGLRASQDVATLLTLRGQLQGYGRAIQEVGTAESLVSTLAEGLRFVERTHRARIVFVSDIDKVAQPGPEGPPPTTLRAEDDVARLLEALHLARRRGAVTNRLCSGPEYGLTERERLLVAPLARLGGPAKKHAARAPCAGVVVRFADGAPTETEAERLECDVMPFIESWYTAEALLNL